MLGLLSTTQQPGQSLLHPGVKLKSIKSGVYFKWKPTKKPWFVHNFPLEVLHTFGANNTEVLPARCWSEPHLGAERAARRDPGSWTQQPHLVPKAGTGGRDERFKIAVLFFVLTLFWASQHRDLQQHSPRAAPHRAPGGSELVTHTCLCKDGSI